MHVEAVALIRQLNTQKVRLLAPALFDYEVETVLRLKVFRWMAKAKNAVPFEEKDAQRVRQIIAALEVETFHERIWLDRAYEMARDFGQARIYDASYAALAQFRGVDLWTADENFYRAVNGPKIPIQKHLTCVRFLGEFFGAVSK